jgi:hypothetical protein
MGQNATMVLKWYGLSGLYIRLSLLGHMTWVAERCEVRRLPTAS